MPDLSTYASRILNDDDKPLFDEAVASGRNGAPRGCYILIWLSAAESLKRKFHEASTRDNAAVQIVNEIEAIEARKESADKTILKRAKEYELIDDVVFQKLTYIYEMRCVYGHPYETAPSDEEIVSAANVVIDEVLGRPTLYRKKYVETLIERLVGNVDFLEPSKASVAEYAREISARIDPSRYKQMANSYSNKLEQMTRDPSLLPLIMRGKWFLTEFFKTVGTSYNTPTEWHDFVMGCPIISQLIFLSDVDLYDEIGQRARNTIVSYALTNARARPFGVKRLEPLWEQSKLSAAQKRLIEGLDFNTVKTAGLKTPLAYTQIIDGLSSHNWPTQNAAADMLLNNSRSELADLTVEQQENLGRNILQAADGTAGSAIRYLELLSSDHSGYPAGFIKGVVFECFLNEANGFRLKNRGLSAIYNIMKDFPEIMSELILRLDSATAIRLIGDIDWVEALLPMDSIPELSGLAQYLRENKARLSLNRAE
ncbi:MAG TPA: hypothetical protein VFT53_02875 [Candidatus Saccharimonadales bacterium]|nr:hypothetical protein [Candidatus Saccharimonadales bacterium]